MKLSRVRWTIGCVLLLCAVKIAFSQPSERPENGAVRVTVSMNADGSRTVYEFDDAQHKAIATTTGEDGKLREKIRYDIDEAGRFSSGTIFGPDGHFRFKSRYNTIALVVWRKKLKAQRAEPFSTRLFTATIRPVSELVIRSLIQMANSLVAQSRAAQVRSEKNSAALCHWIFTP